MTYRLNENTSKWELLTTGAGSYKLKDKDNIKFKYEQFSW